MTVRTSGTPEVWGPDPAPLAQSASAAAFTAACIVVGGTPNGDVIVMSQRALAIVRAGQLVRAFVIAGLETLRRTVTLGATRAVRLENGIYQLA
jgi:hypothetical protein